VEERIDRRYIFAARTLTEFDLRPFCSDYLDGGYRRDHIALSRVELSPGRAVAECIMHEYYTPPDGTYHLTVPIVFLAVANLAIIYAHVENGLDCKTEEVFLRSISLICKRTVEKTSGIGIELKLQHRRSVPDGLYYKGSISVEAGAFEGSASFLFPLRKA